MFLTIVQYMLMVYKTYSLFKVLIKHNYVKWAMTTTYCNYLINEVYERNSSRVVQVFSMCQVYRVFFSLQNINLNQHIY